MMRHLRSSRPEEAEVSYHAIQNVYSNDFVPKAAGVKKIHQILSKANPTLYLTPGSYPLGLKAAGASVILVCGGNAMAANKRTSVRLSEKLLRRARKTLKVSTNEDAVTKALQESLLNREIHASLKDLLRKGRGRFVDVYD